MSAIDGGAREGRTRDAAGEGYAARAPGDGRSGRRRPTRRCRRSGARGDIRRVAIGCDHTGVALEAALVDAPAGRGVAVIDVGTRADRAGRLSRHRRRRSRRPWRAARPTRASSIDGAGLGSAIAANKVRGIRAAMCSTETHGALCARAQRRQRADARLDARRRCRRGDARSSTRAGTRRCAKPAIFGGC